MANEICTECQKICVFKSRPTADELFGSSCDACKVILCRTCSGITTTEAHAIALAQRSIIFFCANCKMDLSSLMQSEKSENDKVLKLQSELLDMNGKMEERQFKHQSEKNDLCEQIEQLTRKGKDKNNYIQRLRKRTEVFEDDVFNVEKDFTDRVEKYKQIVNDLNKEIIAYRQQRDDMQEQQNNSTERIKIIENEVQELLSINKSMRTSIETLSVDNECYITELKRLRLEIFRLNDLNTGLRNACVPESGRTIISSKPKPKFEPIVSISKNVSTEKAASSTRKKILAYGDGSARSIALTLHRFLDVSVFRVEGFVKTSAVLGSLSKDLFCATAHYSQNDHVVLFVDFNINSFFSNLDLKQMFAIGRYTNLIVCCKFNPGYFRHKQMLDKVKHVLLFYRNASIRLLENVKVGHGYSHSTDTLGRLISGYVRNSDCHLGVALVSVPLVKHLNVDLDGGVSGSCGLFSGGNNPDGDVADERDVLVGDSSTDFIVIDDSDVGAGRGDDGDSNFLGPPVAGQSIA